jgi:ubiquinone/menaquinone biosynthesis C-methylase UbiE
MSVNYQYLLSVVEQIAEKNPSITILDYGCGRGQIIKLARSKNLDMYGVDVFHNRSSIIQDLSEEKLFGNIIREIKDDHLPFTDKFFDLIISNQVFEHVPDLDKVFHEIHRVLKPTGTMFALFPSKEIFREGHTGIPFLHWFSKNKTRYTYTLAMRNFGFGRSKKSKELSSTQWVEKFLTYMDTMTFYRSSDEIKILLNKYFFWHHKEEDIINFRAAQQKNILGEVLIRLMRIPGIRQFGSYAFTRLAGYLIVANPK